MLENRYPCVCTHSKINHLFGGTGKHNIALICAVHGCSCDEFRPDNLRYLEKKIGPEQQ